NSRRRHRVTQRGMTIHYLDAKPDGQGFERVIGKGRRNDGAEKAGVERTWVHPTDTGPFAFPLEYGEIESDRVSNYHAVGDEIRKLWPDLSKRWRVRNSHIIDAVDTSCSLGNWTGRPDPTPQRRGSLDVTAGKPQSGDLNNPGFTRIKAGRLSINNNRVEGDERRSALNRHPFLRSS